MKQKGKAKKGKQQRPINNTDKEYYADLYNDLPEEVQHILLQTHPLMGQEEGDPQSAAYRAKSKERGDVEEVREARMQQVATEINEMSQEEPQGAAPTRYVSRRERSLNKYPEAAEQDMDEDDEIGYASMMPVHTRTKAQKHTHSDQNTHQQEESPLERTMMRFRNKLEREREEMPFTDMERMGGRPRYESWDFDERMTQEQLDQLYQDDYEDDERPSLGKFPIIVGIVGLILILFLIFHSVSLRGQLQEAQAKLETVEDLQKRYEQEQLEKMQLQEELEALKHPEEAKKKEEEKKKKAEESKKETAEKKDTEKKDTEKKSEASGGVKMYTVQEGETPWSMAQKFYGNGAEYNKILEANGLTENSNIRPGDQLKIPAA